VNDTPTAAASSSAGPDALIDAYWFDGAGGATPMTWEELDRPHDGPVTCPP